MARVGGPRIAVIGAGPIGIEAALYGHGLGLSVTVYERADIADAVQQWGHVRLFSPFGFNSTVLGIAAIKREQPGHSLPDANAFLTGRDYRSIYLLPLCKTKALNEAIRTGTEVVAVGRVGCLRSDPPDALARRTAPFRLLLRTTAGEEFAEADAILDCSGTYRTPNRLGSCGIPARGETAATPQIAFGLEDILGERKKHYAGRTVLVVGGGYSAATTVCNLAQLADENPATWTIWLTRGPRGQPLPRIPNDPLRERDRLAARANNYAARGEGNIEHFAQVQIEEILSLGPEKGFRVTAKRGDEESIWEAERLIANVGHRPNLELTAALHVESAGVRQPEPNYFLVGMRANAGLGPPFLLRDGFEHIRLAYSLLLNRPKLDLYATAKAA